MKNKFKILIAVVLLVIALWSALWAYGAYRINQEFAALSNANNAPQINCAHFSVTGYPFRFDILCGNGLISAEDEAISFEEFKGAVRIYSPTHMVGFLKGPVNFQNQFTGSQRELNFSSAQMSARLSWQLAIERISLVAANIAWSDNLIGRFELANAEELEVHVLATPNAEKGLDAFARVKNANLMELATSNLNATIELEAAGLNRTLPQWQFPSTLREWQQANGSLNIKKLDVKADDLAFTAEGSVSLNENGLLNGAVTTRSKGLVERFNPESYGIMAPTIFGVANSEGEYQSLWQAIDGTISVGVAALFFVPALF